jgi:hypothetical protein
MASGASSSASTSQQQPAPPTYTIREFDREYDLALNQYPDLGTRPHEHIMETVAIRCGHSRFDVLVSEQRIATIADIIIVVRSTKVPKLSLPKFSFNPESILEMAPNLLPTLYLEVGSVHFPDDQSRQVSPAAFTRLKRLRGLRFIDPIDIDLLRQFLTEEIRNITNVSLCGRELVADDFNFLTQRTPCLAKFSCFNNGYFHFNDFDKIVDKLTIGTKIHGNSLNAISEDNRLKKLELLDCSEIPGFGFFKVYKSIQFLKLENALNLTLENIETAGFCAKLTTLCLLKTPIVCDELLILLDRAKIVLVNLIVPLEITGEHAPGFSSNILRRYLEGRSGSQLKTLNASGHLQVDNTVFSPRYTSLWTLEIFDLRHTPVSRLDGPIVLSEARLNVTSADYFAERVPLPALPSILKVLFTGVPRPENNGKWRAEKPIELPYGVMAIVFC